MTSLGENSNDGQDPGTSESTDLTGDAIPVDDLEAELARHLEGRPRPVDWRQLTVEAAEAEWEALDGWVRWLVGRYDLDGRELPPCWHRHAPLVEELSGLRGVHLIAFDRNQPVSAPSDWHRILWDTRVRLRDCVSRSGCTERTHSETPTAGWIAPSATYKTALADSVAADAASRRRQE